MLRRGCGVSALLGHLKWCKISSINRSSATSNVQDAVRPGIYIMLPHFRFNVQSRKAAKLCMLLWNVLSKPLQRKGRPEHAAVRSVGGDFRTSSASP